MARYRGPRYRLCRREGVNLFGNRKFNMEKRDYPPGQHGASRRTKLSNYGMQLREKQKVKRIYGLLERQFRLYYLRAIRIKGITGEQLLQFLERRLDNTLFRMGFATTRPQARQIVGHRLVQVNGKRVDIPSYSVKIGDEITIAAKDNIQNYIRKNTEATKDIPVPEWLEVDAKGLKGKVVRMPQRDDVQFPINEQLIVELYSK